MDGRPTLTSSTSSRSVSAMINGVSKVDECNKMTCIRCKIYFCWVARQQINGYDDFGKECNLLSGGEQSDKISTKEGKIFEDIEETMAYKVIRHYQTSGNAKCQKCGEINIRSKDRFNKIKFKGCEDELCFQCGRMITEGREHFYVSNLNSSLPPLLQS